MTAVHNHLGLSLGIKEEPVLVYLGIKFTIRSFSTKVNESSAGNAIAIQDERASAKVPKYMGKSK